MNKRNTIIFSYLSKKMFKKLDESQIVLNHYANSEQTSSELKTNLTEIADEICMVIDMIDELEELMQDQEWILNYYDLFYNWLFQRCL